MPRSSAVEAQGQTDWTDTSEREEHCRAHEPYQAWCHVCIAGRGRAYSHAMRNLSEKGAPVSESTTGTYGPDQRRPLVTCWMQKTMMVIRDGVRTSSPVLCGRSSRDGCMLSYLLQSKDNSKRNFAVLGQELMASGYKLMENGRWPVRAHPRTDVEGHSLGNGLAE